MIFRVPIRDDRGHPAVGAFGWSMDVHAVALRPSRHDQTNQRPNAPPCANRAAAIGVQARSTSCFMMVSAFAGIARISRGGRRPMFS
jgi:hypothetical protein